MTMCWAQLTPEEKCAAVRPLAAEGLTSSQIAAALKEGFGPVSRSSVLGLCHRNGIPLGAGSSSAEKARPGLAGEGQRHSKAIRPQAAATLKPERRSHAALRGLTREEQAIRAKTSYHPGGPVAFLALEPECCRWPLWDREKPQDGGFYCGAPRADGASYCTHHQELARVPTAALKVSGLARLGRAA